MGAVGRIFFLFFPSSLNINPTIKTYTRMRMWDAVPIGMQILFSGCRKFNKNCEVSPVKRGLNNEFFTLLRYENKQTNRKETTKKCASNIFFTFLYVSHKENKYKNKTQHDFTLFLGQSITEIYKNKLSLMIEVMLVAWSLNKDSRTSA